MISLHGVTRITTDKEILNRVVTYLKRNFNPEFQQKMIEEGMNSRDVLNLLSHFTGHDTDFIKGYLRTKLEAK